METQEKKQELLDKRYMRMAEIWAENLLPTAESRCSDCKEQNDYLRRI